MDSIQNWYETAVLGKIAQLSKDEKNLDIDSGNWNDVACLALNHLPPRYVCHTVDMSFYMSPQDQSETDRNIENSIQNALAYVRQHPSHSGRSAA